MIEKALKRSIESREGVSNVLALTILDKATLGLNGEVVPTTKLLICIRDPKTNDTHPDVVSVPTMRIPPVIAKKLDTLRYNQEYIKCRTDNTGNTGSPEFLLQEEITSLLTKKLGTGAKGDLEFEARMAYLETGTVEHPNLDDYSRRVEDTRMYNAQILVNDPSTFPTKTTSYSKIWWVTADNFLKMMDGKDVTKVGVSAFDAINGICAQGLCLSSTEKNLRRKLF